MSNETESKLAGYGKVTARMGPEVGSCRAVYHSVTIPTKEYVRHGMRRVYQHLYMAGKEPGSPKFTRAQYYIVIGSIHGNDGTLTWCEKLSGRGRFPSGDLDGCGVTSIVL